METQKTIDIRTMYVNLSDFYRYNVIPIVESFTTDMSDEELLIRVEKIISIIKNLTVDGKVFQYKDYTIEGNDGRSCVNNTEMSTIDEESIHFKPFKKFNLAIFVLKLLLTNEDPLSLEDQWTKYCTGYSMTKEDCIFLAQEYITDAFKKDGVLDQILNKLDNGEWRIV